MDEKELNAHSFEYNIGTSILQGVGSIILLLGISFLLRYSFDHGWLIPNALLGFVLLGGVSAGAAWISFRYNSSIIAGLSLLGASAAPLIIDTFTPSLLALYLILIAAIFSILAAIKRWYWVPLISFGFLVYYYSMFLQSHLTEFTRSLWLIALFYTYMVPYYYGVRQSYRSTLFEIIAVFLVGIFSIWAWYDVAVNKFSVLSAQETFVRITLISGLFYAIYVWWLVRKNRSNIPMLATVYSLMVGCFFAAIIAQYAGYERCIALSLFGFILFLYSIRIQEPLVRLGAYALWLFSTFSMLQMLFYASQSPSLFFNSINTAVLVVTIFLLSAAYSVSSIQRFAYKEQKWLYPTLLVAAVLTPLYWFCTPLWQAPYNSIACMFYAFIVFLSGGIVQNKLLRQCAYWCSSFAIIYFGVYYAFGNVIHPAYWPQLSLFFAASLVSFFGAYFYFYYYKKEFTAYEQRILPKALRIGIALFLYAWVRITIIVSFDEVQQPGFTLARIWGDYDNSTKLIRTHFTNIVLTIYYTIYALIVIIVGLVWHDVILRYAGLVLACSAIIKLGFMIMTMPNTIYRILAFILVGFLLIVGSFVYQRLLRKK